MPEFTLTARAAAPVEEVWKLLFDPTRFPEWWAGIETVQVESPGLHASGWTGVRSSRCRSSCAPTPARGG